MWGAMFSLVVGLIMAGIITAKYPGTIEIVYHDTPILALQDNTSISGGGLIFVTISSSPEYVFYEKNTDGSIEQKRINVRGVKIFESEDDQPFVRRTEEQTKAASPWCLSIGPVFKTEFHVPKGTVIQEYRLDAK
ncbi:hypothetical protein FWF89_02745 [Candidatus Saccharibacteria bacterium]|nr:hypothetical protein [Candidatus Saccharibacteria bacterium]